MTPGSGHRRPYTRAFRARSSAGEHTLHTGGVVGSIPTAPTIALPVVVLDDHTALSLRPGDRLPDFALPGLDRKLRKFVWSFTGNPVVLVVANDLKILDTDSTPPCAPLAAKPASLVVAPGRCRAAGAIWATRRVPMVRSCYATGGKFVPALLSPGRRRSFGQSGAGLRLRVIVLDANQRVAGSFDSRPLLAAAEQIANLANAVNSDGDAGLVVRAPRRRCWCCRACSSRSSAPR